MGVFVFFFNQPKETAMTTITTTTQEKNMETNPYHCSLTYVETERRLKLIHNWYDNPNNGPDYDERLSLFLNLPDEKEDKDEWMDELMTNMLWQMFLCGTETNIMTSGYMNTMIIHCGLLDVMGGNIGSCPDWDMDFNERAYLLSRIRVAAFYENGDTNAEGTKI